MHEITISVHKCASSQSSVFHICLEVGHVVGNNRKHRLLISSQLVFGKIDLHEDYNHLETLLFICTHFLEPKQWIGHCVKAGNLEQSIFQFILGRFISFASTVRNFPTHLVISPFIAHFFLVGHNWWRFLDY